MNTKNVLFLLLVALLFACGGHADFEHRLAVADTLMLTYPDSAYRILCGMDKEANDVSASLRMRHLLLRSNAQNKADVLFTSDSVARLLTTYYDRHGSPNERMLAHYMRGCAYRDMNDWPSAIRCFNEAVAAADTAAVDCDFRQLRIIYGQIAVIFERQYLIEEAIQAYNDAEYYTKDTLSLLKIWENKADALIKKGKINDGLRLKEKVIDSYNSIGYFKEAAQAAGLCIKWYARQGNFKKAKDAIERYEAHSGYFMEDGAILPGKEDYYHIKGTYYEEMGDLDSAEHYFRKLQHSGKDLNSQYLAALGLTRLYQTQQQPDSLAKYAWKTFQYSDSLYDDRVAQNLQQAQAMYNYSRHQETALRKSIEARDAEIRLRNSIIVGITILLAIALAALVFWRRLRFKISRLRWEMRARLTEKSAIEQLLHEEIAEKRQLIASLNKQLNENAADLRQNGQMKETIGILEHQVGELRQEVRDFTRSQQASRLQEESTVIKFIEKARRGKERPNREEWQRVFMLVEKFHPGMLELKKHPAVSPREYRICVLLKLGLNIHSIMFVENTYNADITSVRTRLLKKVYGIKGRVHEFDRRLAEI